MLFKVKPVLAVAFICLIVGSLVAWRIATTPSSPPPLDSRNKISVITSFYPLFFFASRIAGEHADVTNITPAGAEPHDYEPTPRDMARIERGDLLVLNGAGLEPWENTIREVLKNSPIVIVAVGEELARSLHTSEGRDPHVWLNPVLAIEEIKKIEQALERVDPSSREAYKKNAQALIDELVILDAHYREGLRTCKKKDIITSHTAFGYVAAEYGFTQIALTGLSPDMEPTPKRLVEIADIAREKNIRTIFFETLVSPRLAQTIAQEIGAQTRVLNPLEGLTEEDQAKGKDYLTEMENNLTNLKTALECQ
ncbi:MAG: zinc ABC transporter substrate-binding protein [Candidatus Uhrbacteria bacterium]|nr:zinc ABC transporter substrate-binding protein [Candidatus Uhrbacteria bacterium]